MARPVHTLRASTRDTKGTHRTMSYGPQRHVRITNLGDLYRCPASRPDGPDCPECGEEDCETVDSDRWGSDHECEECGHTWHEESAAFARATERWEEGR